METFTGGATEGGPYTGDVQLVTTMLASGEKVSFFCSAVIDHLQPVECVWENSILSMQPSHLTNPEATTVRFDFEGVDIDQFECQLDSGDWKVCTSPHEESRLSPGNHTFSVKGVYDDTFVPASSGRRHLTTQPAPNPKSISWEVKPNFELPEVSAELNVTIPQEGTLRYPITTSTATALQCTVKQGEEITPNCQLAGNDLLISVRTLNPPLNIVGTFSTVLVLKDQTAHAVGVTSELELNFTVNVLPQVHARSSSLTRVHGHTYNGNIVGSMHQEHNRCKLIRRRLHDKGPVPVLWVCPTD